MITNTTQKDIDIIPGDIFIFKTDESYLSKCIAKLTDSDVTHAAMVYKVPNKYYNGKLVEMNAKGISKTSFRINKSNIDKEGREAYHIRLKPTPNSNDKTLVTVADKYVEESDKYDFTLLIFLSSLLVYKELKHTSATANIASTILNFTNQLLSDFINDEDCSDKYQTCSQLVYQIFWDSGAKYMLHTKPFLSENPDLQKNSNGNVGFIRLCDLAAKIEANGNVNNMHVVDKPLFQKLRDGDLEAFAQELYEELEKVDETSEDEPIESDEWNELAAVTKEFIKKREQIFRKLHKDTPIDALLVTPSDILNHTENIEFCQIIRVVEL